MQIKKFSKKQAEILKFIEEDAHYLICDGAVRSGKTIVMVMAFLIWAMSNFNRCNFAICGKTVSNAERNVLKPLQALDGLPYSMTYKLSNRMLTVKCGGIENCFYLFGGKDESSYMLIQGITLAGVLLDEVALMPKSFVDQAMARTLTFSNAKIWFNCNPESPAHWFYQEWVKEAENKGAKHLHFLMDDNPVMTEKEIRRASEQFSGVFYDRYILGKWVLAEGLVFPMFTEENHVTNNLPDKFDEYHISIDYGTLNPCAMLLWGLDYTSRNAVCIKEYYHDGRKQKRQLTDEEYYADLEAFAGNLPIQFIVVDPSAASYIACIRKHSRFTVKQADNAVLDGIRLSGALLSGGHIKIHSSCENFIRELRTYCWDDKSTEDKVIKDNDHCADSFRYYCTTVLRKLRW
jgi:PBSX family phage terminase large subunit